MLRPRDQIEGDYGISKERIRKYGFAFKGKEVLIVEAGMMDNHSL